MKFYARDWRGDGALRMCSFAARGLWIDLVSLMHDEGEPYGHLNINGVAPTAAQLGRMLGAVPRDIEKLTAELEQAGIFSRASDGTIFSRRMVRDKAKAEFDQANGKRGGNPSLNGGVNPKHKAQSPEPESKTKEDTPSLRSGVRAPSQSRGTRWDADREVLEDWRQAAGMKRAERGLPPIDLDYEAERFRNYWAAKSGHAATKVDWKLTWMNWATDKTKTSNGNGHANGHVKQTSTDKHLAGIASLIGDIRAGRDGS